MKDHLYYFHQTSKELAEDICSNVHWNTEDIVLEPFAGENAFYEAIPQELTKYRCEIEDDGGCYKDFDYEGKKPNVIISNPPFRIDGKNVFFDLVLFFSKIKSVKKIIFLCSDICYSSLTPKRMIKINQEGMFINKLDTCSVKKWKGRYRIVIFERSYNNCFNYYLNEY
jgi:hypothetical protein